MLAQTTALSTSNQVPLVASQTHQPPAVWARVLHIINGEHFSGAERVQQLLGKQLPRLGVDADFACVKPGKFSALCGLSSNQVIETPMRGRFDLRVIKTLTKYAHQRQTNLIHAHTPRTALIAALLSVRTGLPWVYHVHSPTARDSTRGFVNHINRWIEWSSLKTCTQLITVSRSLRREMLRCGVPRSRLAVVPNGVPAIEPIDARARADQHSWRIGMIALMRPRKGVEIALEAMKLIKDRNLPITLELIGGFETQSYQTQTLQLLESLGLQDCVHWSGFTDDVPTAIRRLDAMLLPSLFGEGMPMVVLEALAAAVPVIATSVEGTPEVIREGVEGFLAKPADSVSLADKLARLTSSRQDWCAMSSRAVNRHRTGFSDAQMAAKVARIYRRLLAPN